MFPPYREDVLTVCIEFKGIIIKIEVATTMQPLPRVWGSCSSLFAIHPKFVEALHKIQNHLRLDFCVRQDLSSASEVTGYLWREMKIFPPLTLTCTVFILSLQVYNMFSYAQEQLSILTDIYSDYCTIHRSSGITDASQTTLSPGMKSPFMYNRYSYAVSQPDVYEFLKVNLISRKPVISELSPFVFQVNTG